jgi:hypothetical protein
MNLASDRHASGSLGLARRGSGLGRRRWVAGAHLIPSQIQAMFGGGEQGVIYDATNAATMFQERTGTPPATPAGIGDACGSIMDLSPNGNWARAPSDAGRALRIASGLSMDGIDDNYGIPSQSITTPMTAMSAFVRGSAGTNQLGFSATVACHSSWSYVNNSMYEAFGQAEAPVGFAFPSAPYSYFVTTIRNAANVKTRVNGTEVSSRASVPVVAPYTALDTLGFITDGTLVAGLLISRELTASELAIAEDWFAGKMP